MAKHKKRKGKKRYAVALILALLLWPVGWAQAACYGFSDADMPASVATYICEYEGVRRGIISIESSPEGDWVFSQLNDANGVPLAYMLSLAGYAGEGSEFIYYFQLVDGSVLVDRRTPVATELKGQEG